MVIVICTESRHPENNLPFLWNHPAPKREILSTVLPSHWMTGTEKDLLERMLHGDVVAMTPCRLADTRSGTGYAGLGYGPVLPKRPAESSRAVSDTNMRDSCRSVRPRLLFVQCDLRRRLSHGLPRPNSAYRSSHRMADWHLGGAAARPGIVEQRAIVVARAV